IERTIDVEREGLLHQLIIDLEKFGTTDGGAGGIEQELDAAKSCERALGHVVDLVPLGDVDLNGQSLAAFSINLRCRFAGAFLVDIGANDIGALAGKDQRGGAADAAGRTGDNDGLPSKIVRCLRHSLHSPDGILHRMSLMEWPMTFYPYLS